MNNKLLNLFFVRDLYYILYYVVLFFLIVYNFSINFVDALASFIILNEHLNSFTNGLNITPLF
jgi:hypothetical protein